MVKWFKYSFILTLLSLGAAQAYASERAGDFALLDQNGYFHKMSWYDNNRAVVLLVQGNGSLDTERELAGFRALQKHYSDNGMVFFLINPRGETRADVRAQLQAWNIDLPVLIDDVSAISESLGISHFGQAVVFDPRSFRVVYSGPAGPALDSALSEVVAGNAVSNPAVAAQGEPVLYPERDITHVSYSRDVAPIIAENCADCHRDGGIAPFALNSYAMLQGWSPMIREVIRTRRMPPGQVDPHVGEYRNGMTIAFEDELKILDWIAAGSPRDSGPDPLAQLMWPDTVWMFDSEPDLIIEVPEQSIPPTGVIDYINVVVPIEIERDRWVRASQYVAGDPRVLHHTLNFLIPPGADPRSGFTATPDPGAAYIQAYVPGASPHVEPENTGGLLRKGSMLALQLHYTTFGQEAIDNSRIGIWFYDDDNIPTERMTGECACIFTNSWTNIPPNDPEFIQTSSIMIDADAHLHGFISHMHFRGKYMRFEAHLPDGSVQELLNIADYNYNWQITYEPVDPIFVPGGTKIHVIGAFDNSAQNPANPDPSRAVPWGQQSWDEMFFGQVYYKYVDQSRYHKEPQLVSTTH